MRNKMYNYEIIVYQSIGDDAFFVEVLELTRCMADGQSYIEEVQNAEIVIVQWMIDEKNYIIPIEVINGVNKISIDDVKKFEFK